MPGGRRLVASLALLTGIETAIVMTDVCGLSRQEGGELARWAARALVRAALRGE